MKLIKSEFQVNKIKFENEQCTLSTFLSNSSWCWNCTLKFYAWQLIQYSKPYKIVLRKLIGLNCSLYDSNITFIVKKTTTQNLKCIKI